MQSLDNRKLKQNKGIKNQKLWNKVMREIRFQIWKKPCLIITNDRRLNLELPEVSLITEKEELDQGVSLSKEGNCEIANEERNLVEGIRELIWVNTKVKHIHFLWGLCITQFSDSMRPLQFLLFLGFFHFIVLVPKPYKCHLCRENSGVKKAIIRTKNSKGGSNIKWWKCQRYEK